MKRQYYLDYAKCSAIIFMIAIHVFWKLGCDLEAPVGYFIDSFVGDAPQFDDITMICLEYKMKYNN